MTKVLLSYLKNLVYVSIGLSISFLSAKYLSIYLPNITNPESRVIIFLIGTGMLLVAAIGRLGWDIQTWNGNSPAEKLDSSLFWIFAVFGTLLLVFDYCLGFFKSY